MKGIIFQIETMIEDIKSDLKTQWISENESIDSVIQLHKLEHALALLRSVGENQNIK